MEAYEFASEVGARLLQDIVFDEEARWISLDDILCDPKLGRRFHSIAQSITPGYQELDYRWAALSIRKAMNRKVAAKNIPRPEFTSLGVADGVSAESVPDCAGFFWLRSAGVDFYIGHANNLREKVSAMADVELRHRIPVRSSQLPFDSEPLEYLIAAAPEMPVSHRFEVKKRVVSENLPRLNITKEMDRLVA